MCSHDPSPVLYYANKNCPLAGHHLFTRLLTLHTPFLNIVQITVITNQKHVISNTHFEHFLQRQFLSREINFETFMKCVTHDTSPPKLALQDGNNIVITIHRCFTLSAHNSYSEVAMVTIQEVLLWLPVVIRGIESL